MTALYQLSKELAQIHDELFDAQGELSTELETRLDQVNLALTEKATGLRKWLAMIDTDTNGLDAEIARLTKIKKQHVNLYERLKVYVHKNMLVADLKKIETPIGTFTVAKNPPSVEGPTTPELLEQTPEQYRVPVPATWTPDKKLIKAALEEGYEVLGWKLITDRTNLKIK